MVQDPAAPVAIFRSTEERECRDRAFVLHAVGIAHGIMRDVGGFVLVVGAADAERARAELSAYAIENVAPPVEPVPPDRQPGGMGGAIGYVMVLMTVALLAQREFAGFDWYAVGKTSAEAIRQGQWWRTVTALTLHADWAHLIGNLLVGAVVGWLVSGTLGAGLAWLTLLLTGAAGNLINGLVRAAEHTSVGASTAVFAGIGLLAAQGWRTHRWRSTKMERWAPLVGGMLLLSFLGTGGGRTDVPAHVFGFACGVVAGALSGLMRGRWQVGQLGQVICGVSALALLVVSWWMALAQSE